MNRIVREFDREHPGLRSKLNKVLSKEIKLYNKIGWPKCITNQANLIVMRMVKIIVEDGE